MDKLMQEYKQECAIYSKIASSIWKIGLVIISILYIKLSYGGQNYFEIINGQRLILLRHRAII